MSKNQRGFSAVESLLVLTIVILIGAVGYMVYKNHHKTSGSTNNSNVSVEATSPSNSPYTGWKIYTALSHISFKYPSNWTVTTSNNAPVSKSVTVNAPSRNIGGTNYQFGLSFTAYSTSSQYIPPSYITYSTSTITDSSFTKPLYALVVEEPQSNSNGNSSCQVMDIEESAKNLKSGTATNGDYTIPTHTEGTNIDVDGNYTKTDTSGLSYDQTLGCFNPTEFGSFLEIQQAEKIFNSLAEN